MIRNNFRTLRFTIGILGLFFPLGLYLQIHEILPSISEYYYTVSRTYFAAILGAYSLLLVSYEGYDNVDSNITTLAGLLAATLLFIPTKLPEGYSLQCGGHESNTYLTIHLVSAGLFFICMAYMSIVQFSKGSVKRIYKILGYLILAMMILLIIRFTFNINYFINDIFWLETVMLVAFGTSWIIKACSFLYDPF